MAKVPKKYFEKLVENSLDIIIATDTHGRVIFYNDGAKKNLGYSREKAVGKHVTSFYPDIAEARKVMRAMRTDPQGRCVNFETVFVAKNEDHIPVSITGAIIYNDRHDELGTIGFAKDIREIRRKDQLATLGEIAIGLSHEINNPLASITMNLELLRGRILEDPAHAGEREQVEAIQEGVERIRARIDSIERMARSGTYASREYLHGAQMIDLEERGEEVLSSPVAAPGPDLSGLRILVVDDDPTVAASLEEFLSRQGCRVRAAGDGEQAMARLAEGVFDLVLSDVVMPNMDGYDLFRKVKASRPETAVVLMTAYYHDKDHIIKRAKMKGLEGSVFKKPINPDHLKKVIARACRRAA